MSSGENVFVVDERPAAELSTGVEEGRDPRPLSQVGVVAAYDSLLILVTVLRPALGRVHANGATISQGLLAGGRHGRRPWPPGGSLRRPGRRRAGFFRAGGNWSQRGDRC